jgi:hypothetical protein
VAGAGAFRGGAGAGGIVLYDSLKIDRLQFNYMHMDAPFLLSLFKAMETNTTLKELQLDHIDASFVERPFASIQELF